MRPDSQDWRITSIVPYLLLMMTLLYISDKLRPSIWHPTLRRIVLQSNRCGVTIRPLIGHTNNPGLSSETTAREHSVFPLQW